MLSLLDRLESQVDGARLRGRGVEVEQVAASLEAGAPAGDVASRLGLEPVDVVAAVASLGLGPEGSEGPELVQARPSRLGLAGALQEEGLASLLPGSDRKARLALAAGLLQVLDFWDLSHNAAQEADDLGERQFSAYWHGIAHRREPDPGNASYWFRRVGRHPLFPSLATEATPLLRAEGRPDLADRLIRDGAWDPLAFITFGSSAATRPDEARLARRLQRLEMDRLLTASWNGASR